MRRMIDAGGKTKKPGPGVVRIRVTSYQNKGKGTGELEMSKELNKDETRQTRKRETGKTP